MLNTREPDQQNGGNNRVKYSSAILGVLPNLEFNLDDIYSTYEALIDVEQEREKLVADMQVLDKSFKLLEESKAAGLNSKAEIKQRIEALKKSFEKLNSENAKLDNLTSMFNRFVPMEVKVVKNATNSFIATYNDMHFQELFELCR